MKAAVKLEVLPVPRCQLGESPLWSVREAALYWVDIEGRCVHRWQPASARHEAWGLPERVGCIVLHADGDLVAALESGVFHLQLATGAPARLRLLHSARHPQAGMRFNDGRTDREGRLWVSSMRMDTTAAAAVGALHCADAQHGLVALPGPGLVVGNGLGFSPDGRTMYLSDSHASVQQVWAFDLDAQGLPGQRRPFIDFRPLPGRPDGAAVDAEGGYWICANDGGTVLRFTPEGHLDRELPVPVAKPSMCAFGGPQLNQLFITSITPATPVPGYDPALAGALLVAEVGVRGIAETPYGARRHA